MPEITFVNHASYIVRHGGISLICDPWLENTVFNEGWSLIEPTKFQYCDFSAITHIWFSHEHPDHFTPPNLRKIPLEIRRNITILYHETKDKKVINFCKDLGFKECVELKKERITLGENFSLMNIPQGEGDSWILIECGNVFILNLNDCVFEDDSELKKVKSKINAEKIDILFTQFSYANWVGNKEDYESRKYFAREKLNEVDRQISILKPKFTVPFASYVWFCHEENFYMNDEINKIDRVYQHLKQKSQTIPVILFPGETWEVPSFHDSENSVKKWMSSYEKNIAADKVVKKTSVSDLEIVEFGNSFIQKIKTINTLWIYIFLRPSHVFVEDLGFSYRISLSGVERSNQKKINCDIAMGSQSLLYCFKFLWGGSTTRINGRYQIPEKGNFFRWKLFFQIAELNNHGEIFDTKFIFKSFYKRIRKKNFFFLKKFFYGPISSVA